MRFKNLQLRSKLVLLITAVSTIVLVLASALFSLSELYKFKKDLMLDSAITVEIIGSQCVAPIHANDTQAANDTLAALSADENIT